MGTGTVIQLSPCHDTCKVGRRATAEGFELIKIAVVTTKLSTRFGIILTLLD